MPLPPGTSESGNVGRESLRRGLGKEWGTAFLNVSGQCAVAVVTIRL